MRAAGADLLVPVRSRGRFLGALWRGALRDVLAAAFVASPFALFVTNPGWRAFFDQDPKMAEETRRKVYDMLVAEKMLLQGFHYPFPALAHVEKSGSGYREIPVPWNPTI